MPYSSTLCRANRIHQHKSVSCRLTINVFHVANQQWPPSTPHKPKLEHNYKYLPWPGLRLIRCIIKILKIILTWPFSSFVSDLVDCPVSGTGLWHPRRDHTRRAMREKEPPALLSHGRKHLSTVSMCRRCDLDFYGDPCDHAGLSVMGWHFSGCIDNNISEWLDMYQVTFGERERFLVECHPKTWMTWIWDYIMYGEMLPVVNQRGRKVKKQERVKRGFVLCYFLVKRKIIFLQCMRLVNHFILIWFFWHNAM